MDRVGVTGRNALDSLIRSTRGLCQDKNATTRFDWLEVCIGVHGPVHEQVTEFVDHGIPLNRPRTRPSQPRGDKMAVTVKSHAGQRATATTAGPYPR